MSARPDRPSPMRSRRWVLAAGAGALVVGAGALLGCGKDEAPPPAKGSGSAAAGKTKKPHRPSRPVKDRPPGASAEKVPHARPQPSASRSREPLPPELHAYALRKLADGALVRGRTHPVIHHPVLCRKHLGKGTGSPATTRPGERLVLHARYTDGILYALMRAEPDARVALGLALVGAITWPVSTHFGDFALGALRRAGKAPDEATLADALRALDAGGARTADATTTRARAAVRALRDLAAARAAAKEHPPERKRRRGR